jgi:hypothetical protein
MMQPIPTITLDFSNSDENELLFARTARASVPVSEGMELIARDGEGHECRVRVEQIEGPIAYLRPDWDTWAIVPVDAWTTVDGMIDEFRDIPASVPGNGHSPTASERSTNLVCN